MYVESLYKYISTWIVHFFLLISLSMIVTWVMMSGGVGVPEGRPENTTLMVKGSFPSVFRSSLMAIFRQDFVSPGLRTMLLELSAKSFSAKNKH